MKPPSLQELFEQLKTAALDSTTYQGKAADAAFELTTFDTFLAGAASTLLSGGTPPPEVLVVLEKPLPLKGTRWSTERGELVELTAFPELREFAGLLEELRVACLRRIHS